MMSRRTFAGAIALAVPGAAAAQALASSGAVENATSLQIELPDAPRVCVRLFDIVPAYPGSNGGRLDMRTSADGASFADASGSYSWAFSETYDDSAVLYTASAADHGMSDRVRLCTATSKAGGAEFELMFTRPCSMRPKLWRWVGNTQFIDGRVCGYQGFAVRKSTDPIAAIRLFPDVGTFSMSYTVEALS